MSKASSVQSTPGSNIDLSAFLTGKGMNKLAQQPITSFHKTYSDFSNMTWLHSASKSPSPCQAETTASSNIGGIACVPIYNPQSPSIRSTIYVADTLSPTSTINTSGPPSTRSTIYAIDSPSRFLSTDTDSELTTSHGKSAYSPSPTTSSESASPDTIADSSSLLAPRYGADSASPSRVESPYHAGGGSFGGSTPALRRDGRSIYTMERPVDARGPSHSTTMFGDPGR
ncbi:hypothetical protein F5Y15DRAFT_399283 [Xylariaceae sp. FL0016]|nr:hypothetical protein F5Y15DRAFT_399283 [Xylariaceae sp. FL0016]